MFEDIFGQLIGEIVTCCLEYLNNMADDIYVYMNFLDDDVFSDFCFSINDISIDKYFISNEIYMDGVFNIENYIHEKSKEIKCAFKKFNKNIPLEIKITYNTLINKLSIDNNYIDYEKAKKTLILTGEYRE